MINKKRIVALLLVVTLFLGIFPITAAANEQETSGFGTTESPEFVQTEEEGELLLTEPEDEPDEDPRDEDSLDEQVEELDEPDEEPAQNKPDKIHKQPEGKPSIIVKYRDSAQADTVIHSFSLTLDSGKNLTADDIAVEEIDTAPAFEMLYLDDMDAADLNDVIDALEADSNVVYAQPNYILEPLAIPENAALSNQWGLINTGQTINGVAGVAGVDINILPLWESDAAYQEVIVGLLDMGVDTNHPDLAGQTVPGWDFVNGDATTFDKGDLPHGTNMAGIIAAAHNSQGIAGVAPNAKIMPLKFIEGGTGYTSDAIAAIEYAAQHGVQIINCSFGSTNYNPALQEVMAKYDNILFICAAGNNGNDTRIYPASYTMPHVVSVGAVTNTGDYDSRANYGGHVQLAAPGANIYTTGLNHQYEMVSGTSAAAAFVTGAAALFAGNRTGISPADTAGALLDNARNFDSLSGRVRYGMLDTAAFVNADAIREIELDDDILDFLEAPLPDYVTALLAPGTQYTTLSEEEKFWLFEYLFLSEEAMMACSEAGLDIIGSVTRAHIMQRMGIDYDQTMAMIVFHSSEKAAKEQAIAYKELTWEYAALNTPEAENVPKAIALGHKTQNAIQAFLVELALNEHKDANADSYSLLDFIAKIPDEMTDFEHENAAAFMGIAQKYTLNLQAVTEIANELSLGADALLSAIEEMQALYLIEVDPVLTPMAAPSDPLAGKDYPSAPISLRGSISEDINLQTGSILLHDNALSIPGRNGLDLNLVMQYSSANANQINYSNFGGQSRDFVYAHGWSLVQTRIIMDGITPRYLMLENGSTIEIEENGNSYKFADYKLTDITFAKAPSQTPVTSAAYMVSYKDGKKEYLDTFGNLLATIDRYGNRISYDMTVYMPYAPNDRYLPYSFSGYLKITDSWGNVVKIENSFQNGNEYGEINIDYPGGDNVRYEVLVGTLPNASGYGKSVIIDKKRDALKLKTTFYYTGSVARFSNENKNMGYSAYYYNLTDIYYPNSLHTEYTYEKVRGNCNKGEGLMEYFRVTQRQDMDVYTVYNREQYSYSANNYTGYTGSNTTYDTNQLPSTYKYDTIVTYGMNQQLKKVHLFNNKHFLTRTTTNESGYMKLDNHYSYNSNKTLNNTLEYTYRSGGQSHSHPLATNYTFDTANNVTQEIRPLAETSTAAMYKINYTYYTSYYHLPKSVTYYQDANTVIRKDYELTADNKSVKSEKTYVNNVLSGRVDYGYDSYGNVTSTTAYSASGSAITTNITYQNGVFATSISRGGVTEYFTYDQYGRMLTSKDGKGYTTTFTYDKLGRVTKQTNPDNTTKAWQYTDKSDLIVVTDERGNKLQYKYYKYGKIWKVTDLTTNDVLETYVYNASMNPTSYTNTKGSMSLTYDAMERLKSRSGTLIPKETYVYEDVYDTISNKVTKTVEGDANAPNIVTVSYTDKYGRLLREGVVSGSTEYLTRYEYDLENNLIQELSAKDAAAGHSYSTKYQYDYMGNVTRQVNALGDVFTYTYDWLGRNTAVTDPKGSVSQTKYDARDRVTEQRTPLEGSTDIVTNYTYDNNGNVTREQTPTTRTDYAYNNMNRMTRVTGYDGNTSSYTSYTYDNAGNRLTMATANGTQTTAFTYDHRNRLITKTDALGQIERYSYDNEDNMTSKTDRNGTVFTMTYNPMNQPLSTTAGGQTEHLTYTYTKTGAIRTEANETQTTTNFYDNRGFLVKQTESSGAQKQYAYDINGNRTSFVLFEGSQQKLKTTYEYDRLNRLTKVYENDALVASYTYDANGNRESLTYGNGITTIYSYNKANLVTSLTNSQRGTLSSYSYTYYNDGNQRSKTDHTGRTTNYVYDGMGRLKSEVESDITKSYTYDLAGNRATMTVSGLDNPAGNRATMTVSGLDNYTTTYSYDRNNRLLTETKDSGDALATITYAYDANGNQLSKVGGTLSSSIGNPVVVGLSVLGQSEDSGLVAEINTYNAFNQLTQVQTARHSVSYAYKADGLRISKTADGVTTGFVWDGSNIVGETKNGDYQTYTRGIGLIRNGAGEYYLFDAHGDVVQMAGAGGVVREYRYDAFGNEVEPDENDTNPFRYCGEYWDAETNTIYLRNRNYAPASGRFLSEDPIMAGMNWYTYANSNPVAYIDPTGLISKSFMLGLASSYASGSISSESVAKSVVGEWATDTFIQKFFSKDSKPDFTILHNIAQVFSGAAAKKSGYKTIDMEYSMLTGKTDSLGRKKYNYADLVDIASALVWEIKPVGGNPEPQLQEYMKLGGFQRGSVLPFDDAYKLLHVKTLTSEYDLVMHLSNAFIGNDPQFMTGSGGIYYTFSIKHKDGRSEVINTSAAYDILIRNLVAQPMIPALPGPAPAPSPSPAPVPIPIPAI